MTPMAAATSWGRGEAWRGDGGSPGEVISLHRVNRVRRMRSHGMPVLARRGSDGYFALSPKVPSPSSFPARAARIGGQDRSPAGATIWNESTASAPAAAVGTRHKTLGFSPPPRLAGSVDELNGSV